MTDSTGPADARFEDAGGTPLRLAALEPDDLKVISALLQDSVTGRADMAWLPKRRRFTALVNRFRWEDRKAAQRQGRPYERVRTILQVESVLRVRSDGIDPGDKDAILSLLALNFTPGEDGTGTLTLVFAGDGEIALDVECLDVTLTDVTRPYLAQAKQPPHHADD